MRVALVHDYIKEYGGAERVLETLHELYPDAPVFTTVYLPEYLGPHKERFADWDVRTSFLQWFPFKAKFISPFRLLSPFAFKQFDFSEFDVIIVSATGGYFPNLVNKKSAQLICYCHTPPRYLYGYATAREWKKNIVFRVLGEIANHFLRMVDFRAAQNVDQFIANSEEVRSRIKKFYRKEAVVIYPPVDTKISNFQFPISNKKNQLTNSKLTGNWQLETRHYYLAGGRLARAKHIELIVKACIEKNIPLKVFGKGFAGYESELRSLAKSKELRAKSESQIEFVGEVSDEEKFELMRNAKAYIMASEDEDFGILPVESMAAGTPVIAYRSGGVKETVLEGNPLASSGQGTGVFFDALTIESLLDAIKRFEKTKFDPDVCRKRAELFSKDRFLREIDDLVNEKIKNKNE